MRWGGREIGEKHSSYDTCDSTALLLTKIIIHIRDSFIVVQDRVRNAPQNTLVCDRREAMEVTVSVILYESQQASSL